MLVFALLVLLPVMVITDTISCYACVSEGLRGRWEITGLPKISDQYYGTCSPPTSGRKESCAGPCFTMVFDDPEVINQESGSGGGGSLLFVRGCHSTMMQVTTNRSSTNANPYCELDNSYPMADSRGTIQHVNMLMEFCSTADCNVRKTYSDCVNQNTDLLNNQPIQCYECTPKQGNNCKEGRCTKKYCMRQTVKLGGAYQTTKACSNVNLIGMDNYCMTNDVFSTPGGVAVKNRYSLCYCKNKHFCNSTGRLTVLLSLFVTLFV